MKSYQEGRDSPCPKCEFMGIRDKKYYEGITLRGFGSVPDIIDPECMLWICPYCGFTERSETLNREKCEINLINPKA